MNSLKRYWPLLLVVVAVIAAILILPSVGGDDSDSDGESAQSSSTSAPETPEGDTTHCVDELQFDPSIYFYAPPCVGQWDGGDNGGATYQGVTADTIKVVQYQAFVDPAIQALMEDAGYYTPTDKIDAFAQASAEFINANYELYGRTMELSIYEGTCSLTPVDVACLRNEFKQIVEDEQPFMVIWPIANCSACFDELSALETPNLGGMYFTNQFSEDRAPYHWDVQPSGTDLNQSIGQFWCSNLAGEPASLAVDGEGSVNGQPRKLGVVGVDDPEVEASVEAAHEALADCDEEIAASYFSSAELATAVQQIQAGLASMLDAGVTSVYYLSDIANPGYFMGGSQTQKYLTENIMSGSGTQDRDDSAQQFITNPIACPLGAPCAFQTGIGLSTNVYEPLGADAAARVWAAAGNEGPVPYNQAGLAWDYYALAATLIQAAGPDLTPQNMADGVRAYPARGDAEHALRGLPDGTFTWTRDYGLLYFEPEVTSSYNGEKGAWEAAGDRYELGQWPDDLAAEIPNR